MAFRKVTLEGELRRLAKGHKRPDRDTLLWAARVVKEHTAYVLAADKQRNDVSLLERLFRLEDPR